VDFSTTILTQFEENIMGIDLRPPVAFLGAALLCLGALAACSRADSLSSSEAALQSAEATTDPIERIDDTAGTVVAVAPDPTPTTTASPIPTPTATPIPPFAFTAASVPNLGDEGPLMEVRDALGPTSERPQWIMAGVITEDGHSTPTVWVSETADIGTARPIALEDTEYGVATRVTAIDDVVIAVGSISPDGESVPAVWRLEDARWQRVDESGVSGEIIAFGNLFAIDGVLIATGTQKSESGESQFSVLVSNDKGSSWSRSQVDDFDHPVGISMHGVALFGDRLVAVGYYTDVARRSGAGVIWSSDDRGETWVQVDEVTGGQEVRLSSIIKHGDRLVIVGAIREETERRPTVWTSIDGDTWRREDATFARTDTGASSLGYGATNLRTNGDRLLARSSRSILEVWTSADGISWESIPGLRDRERLDWINLVDVGFNLDGSVVAVDGRRRPLEHRSGVWSRTGEAESFPRPSEFVDVYEVAWNKGRFVAVGSATDGSSSVSAPQVWWSDEGETWQSGTLHPDSSTGLREVTATTAGFVAAGTAGFDDYEFDPPERLWYSSNGKSWGLQDTFDQTISQRSIFIFDLAALRDDVFIVGVTYEGADDILRPVAGFGSADAHNVKTSLITSVRFEQYATAACGSPEQSVAFMNRSTQGVSIRATWYAAETHAVRQVSAEDESFTSAGSQSVTDCLWTGTDFVAVGMRTEADQVNGAIWRSADGLSWSLAEIPRSMLAPGDQWVTGVASYDGGLVVFGEDEGGHGGSVLWVLHDDRWSLVENPMGTDAAEGVRIDDLVIGDGQMAAVGESRGVDHIWTATLDSLLESLTTSG